MVKFVYIEGKTTMLGISLQKYIIGKVCFSKPHVNQILFMGYCWIFYVLCIKIRYFVLWFSQSGYISTT